MLDNLNLCLKWTLDKGQEQSGGIEPNSGLLGHLKSLTETSYLEKIPSIKFTVCLTNEFEFNTI